MQVENPLNRCNFIRNLCTRIADIHNEVIEHENSFPKCEICSECSNDFFFIKNQLFLIMKIHFDLKNENHSTEIEHEKKSEIPGTIEDTLHVSQYEIAKEEVGDTEDEDTKFFSPLVSVEDYSEESSDKITLEKDASNVNSKTNSTSSETREKSRKIKNQEISKRYECELCGLKVTRKNGLVLHVKSHLKRKGSKKNTTKENEVLDRKQCPFCNRIYKRNHECNWGGMKTSSTFTCSYCPEVFTTFGKILTHHKAQHPGKPRPLSPYQCEICGSFATRVCDLRRHMLSHTDIRPFKCNNCEKKYHTKRELVAHQRRHVPKSERDDKFKCDLCGKRYVSRSSLTNHKRFQHANDRKDHLCTFCGLKFVCEQSLVKHQTIHEGEAPRAHKCDECGRYFDKLKYFNHHRKIRHNIFTDLMLNPKTKKKQERKS